MPTAPKIGKACRHVITPSSATTIGCVIAPPSAPVITARPNTRPRASSGNQRENTREIPGNAPASPIPNSRRTVNSDAKPAAAPVSAVIADHQITIRVSIARDPNRSTIQPAGTSISAYARVNALKT